jgi:hypothetical protein
MMKRTLYFGFAGVEDEVSAVVVVSETINDAAHRNERPIVTNVRLMSPLYEFQVSLTSLIYNEQRSMR